MVIGLDPGMNGGMAAVEGGSVVAVLSKLGARSDEEILAWLRQLHEDRNQPPRAFVEKVASMPRQGVKSTFTFGREFGRAMALLSGAGIRYELVTPQRWQRALNCLTKGDKRVTKELAQKAFPDIKVTHSIADALLIAMYGELASL